MKLHQSLLLLCLAASACSSRTQWARLADADQVQQLGAGQAVAVAPDGAILLAGGGQVWRLDATRPQAQALLVLQEKPPIPALAASVRGAVLVLRPSALMAVLEGALVEVQAGLGGGAQLLSLDRDRAWIAAWHGEVTRLLRLDLSAGGPRLRAVLDSADPIQAICAVPGGCLVAAGPTVHKVFDPGAEESVESVLLLALHADVTGLAADPQAGLIYVATAQHTFAWSKGQVLPLLPLGGTLAWGRGRLVLRQADGTPWVLERAAAVVGRLQREVARQ